MSCRRSRADSAGIKTPGRIAPYACGSAFSRGAIAGRLQPGRNADAEQHLCAARSAESSARFSERLHRGDGSPPARVRHAANRSGAAACRALLDRSCLAAREHRELHRRRAGSDRSGGPAADPRGARQRALLCAARDDRRHAGGELQPRHAADHRVRRRADHRGRAVHAAFAGFRLRRCAEAARVRKLGRGALRRDQGGRGSDEPGWPPGQYLSVRRRADAPSALQLHHRRCGRSEHDRQGDAGRVRVDHGALPGRRALPAVRQHGYRQETLTAQYAGHARQARSRRSVLNASR